MVQEYDKNKQKTRNNLSQIQFSNTSTVKVLFMQRMKIVRNEPEN